MSLGYFGVQLLWPSYAFETYPMGENIPQCDHFGKRHPFFKISPITFFSKLEPSVCRVLLVLGKPLFLLQCVATI